MRPFVRPPAEIVNDPVVNGDAWRIVPEMIRAANACDAPRVIVAEVPVRVTVDVPAAKVEDAPDVSHEPDAVIDPLVTEIVFAEASFIVTPATAMDAVVPISEPPFETRRTAPPVMLYPAVVSVPEMESVPLTSMALPSVTDPETVKLLKPLVAFSVRTVFVAPDIVTVLVPLVRVELRPDVSQLPLTVHAPLVRTMAPDVPPVIVTSTVVTADAFAIRIPALPMVSEPPAKARPAVASAVVEPAASWIVSVPPHFRAFVNMVNVTAPLEADDWNARL